MAVMLTFLLGDVLRIFAGPAGLVRSRST